VKGKLFIINFSNQTKTIHLESMKATTEQLQINIKMKIDSKNGRQTTEAS